MALTFTSASPDNGTTDGGTPVTITGTGFLAVSGVTFDGVDATAVVTVNATTVTCIAPAHAAGAVDVVVTNGDTATVTGTAAYLYVVPPPSLYSVTPEVGPTAGGTAVTIRGIDFVAVSGVTFGGVAATAVVTVNSTTVTCTTPAHARGPVVVTMTNGDAQTGTGFFAYSDTTARGNAGIPGLGLRGLTFGRIR